MDLEEKSIGVGDSAALPASVLPVPTLCHALDVNALNYCRFSLLSFGATSLIAVPNLVESAWVSDFKTGGISDELRNHRLMSGRSLLRIEYTLQLGR